MIFWPFVIASFKSHNKFTTNKLHNFANFRDISNPLTTSFLELFVMIFRSFVVAPFKSYNTFTINKLRNFDNFRDISNPLTETFLESLTELINNTHTFYIKKKA